MISVNKISRNEVVLELSQTVSPERAEKVFDQILHSTFQTVTVDCSRLIHLGHRLLGKLYMFNMDLRVGKRKLILKGCSAEICSLLRITKLDERVEIAEEQPQKPLDTR
jgi:anti-anti-sigma regulatory factor